MTTNTGDDRIDGARPPGLSDRWPGLVAAVVLCQAVGVTGALLTNTGRSPWYRSLEKPAFNPPAWVFGPVWTTLYAMMGVALFLLWRRRHAHRGARAALGAFAVQLALNAAWTPVFFGARSLAGGLVVIVLLWLAIAATIALGWRASRAAALLLVPYLLWVTFATALNATLLSLNRDHPAAAAADAADLGSSAPTASAE